MVKILKKRSVVIVGGGLTAGLVARQLTLNGIDVVVLERGKDPRTGPADKLPTQRDELRWAVKASLAQDWSLQTVTVRHSRNSAALPARRMQAFLPGEGLGGAGNHWNGNTWRWAEYDSLLRTHHVDRYGPKIIPTDMPIQDWGITYRELAPYYELFENLFGISGKAGNINGIKHPAGNPFEAPRTSEYPLPPLEITEAGIIFSQAARQLGYHPFPTPAANSSQNYTNPDGVHMGCCQYCGHCELFLCEAGAKATPGNLLYPMLLEKACFELRLGCHVLEIKRHPTDKRVEGVRYIDLSSGEELFQPADLVVLSAFTLSNVKLLLTAGIGSPYDPATGKGVVGKNFCYQTSASMDLFFKDRWINPFMASGSTGTVIDDFNNDHFDHSGLGFIGGGMIRANVLHGRPITSRKLPPKTPLWGTNWKKANADWYAHSFSLNIQGTCYPHIENYLDLDPRYNDAYGQPLIRLNFDWRENEKRMLDFVTKKMIGIANNSGATIISAAKQKSSPFDIRSYQSTHITGGTIMGEVPENSVVTPRLQHWDAKNLFIIGASVLPHNSGYNPTGPIAALALRLGDDLVSYLKNPSSI